jgi:hypothetical protein
LAAQGLTVGGDVGLSFSNVTFSKEISGYVYYDGVALTWKLATPVGGLSIASFTSGVLRLNHDSVVNTFDIVPVPFNGGYMPYVSNVAANYTEIKLFNSSGTQVTTADTNMKFFFTRRSNNESINLADTTLFTGSSGHNIWYHGIFEV